MGEDERGSTEELPQALPPDSRRKFLGLAAGAGGAGTGAVGVAAEGKRVCPCHDSRFENDGRVAGGPAPRGLDGLACDVKEGRVRVVFERFQVGVSEKRAI